MSQQTSPELAALLVAMRDAPSVPDGWDAVLTLSQSAVQSLVQSNWGAASGADRDRPLLWIAPEPVNGLHDAIEVTGDVPLPSVSLSTADRAVRIDLQMVSGTVRLGHAPAESMLRLAGTRSAIGDIDVSWSGPVAITRQTPLRLSGLVPVAVDIAGEDGGFSIGLDLADGDLALSGQAVNQNLERWFAAPASNCLIASLTRRNGTEATVLTPASVAVRIATSLDGQSVLQILTGTSPGTPPPVVNAPVPHPDAHDFSLTVTSKATMTMIANGYNLGTGDIKLAAVPPQDEQRHWFAQVHEPMVFEGNFGNQNGTVYVTDHAKLYMRFGGSTESGLQLFTHIDPSSTIRLQLDLAAHYPISIGGTGADQVVGLQSGTESVIARGFYEAIVRPQLETFLDGDIKSDMARVRLTAVSDLALRDLTLAGHRLQFEIAALPAELLVAGRLTPDA